MKAKFGKDRGLFSFCSQARSSDKNIFRTVTMISSVRVIASAKYYKDFLAYIEKSNLDTLLFIHFECTLQ